MVSKSGVIGLKLYFRKIRKTCHRAEKGPRERHRVWDIRWKSVATTGARPAQTGAVTLRLEKNVWGQGASSGVRRPAKSWLQTSSLRPGHACVADGLRVGDGGGKSPGFLAGFSTGGWRLTWSARLGMAWNRRRGGGGRVGAWFRTGWAGEADRILLY